MISLKATEEPMPIRARRAEIVVVVPTAVTGTEVRRFTWRRSHSVYDLIKLSRIGFWGSQASEPFLLTSLIFCQNGSPRSRAKDQNIREDDARRPTVDEIPSTRTIDAMIAVPETDLVASRKT